MKSKFVFGLIATMLVLALAPSSFAQVNIQIFGANSPQEIATTRAAQTADPQSSGAGLTVSGSVIANVELTTTRLDLTFPGPITSSPTVPSGDPLRIEGATGLFTGASISTILFSSGVVQITLPESKTGTTPSGSFRVVGARIDVNGKTAPLQATASLANTANGYINTSTPQTVINALGAGIGSMAIGARTSTATNLGTATVFSNAVISDAGASVTITEGFASAWRAAVFPGLVTGTASTATGMNGTQIRLTVAGLATGQTLSVATAASSTLSFTMSGTTFSSTTTARTITITGASLTATENMQLDFTVTAAGTAPLTPAAITLTATLAPIGDQTQSNGTPITTNGYPTFAQADVGPVTIANVVAASTTLLVPFAVRDGAFDTGISLANTTADPFGTTGGATAQGGTIRLDFFPRSSTGGAGTAFSLTTSATARPGIGLSSDGTLAAGATWTVLLSELLTAAGQTGSFTGYIFIQTNFLLAHGAPFVSDFRNFTSYSPMLVLPSPITAARTGFESLNN